MQFNRKILPNTPSFEGKINTDSYVNEAIFHALRSSRDAVTGGASFKESCLAKTMAVDEVENVVIGVGYLSILSKDNSGPSEYAKNIEEYRIQLKSRSDEQYIKDVMLANFKLRLILKSLKAKTGLPFDGLI